MNRQCCLTHALYIRHLDASDGNPFHSRELNLDLTFTQNATRATRRSVRRSSTVKPGTHYPHVTWAHIKLTFYFQLLPYPFPYVGSHMLISIIWWLGVIQKRPLAHFFNKHFFHFCKQLVTSEERSTRTLRRHEMCATTEILIGVLARELTRAPREITWRKQSDRSVNLRHRIKC